VQVNIVPVRQIISYIFRFSVNLGFFGSHKKYGFHVFMPFRNKLLQKKKFDFRFACKKTRAKVCSSFSLVA
jgi:hypothetical protein